MTPKNWHALEVNAAIEQLQVDAQRGLSAGEVTARLQRYGANELTRQQKASPWTLLFNQFRNILVLILIAATVLSAFVGEYVDALIILTIVIFCAVLGFVQEYRAERALDALRNMLIPLITVLRGGREEETPSRNIVPGDILLLEAGDKIPADARLIESHSLHCDEAPLTGESMPVTKHLAPMRADATVADRRNMVFTGTVVTFGRGKAVVCATSMRDMARRNALVRRMPAVETLGCVSVICTDKTGTLTKGEMTVRRVYAGGNAHGVRAYRGVSVQFGAHAHDHGACDAGRAPACVHEGRPRSRARTLLIA